MDVRDARFKAFFCTNLHRCVSISSLLTVNGGIEGNQSFQKVEERVESASLEQRGSNQHHDRCK